MADYDDELDALRRLDPVDMAALPSAEEPQARALFERITMTQTETRPVDIDEEGAPSDGNRRRSLALAAAAAVVVLVLGAVGVMALNGDSDEPAEDTPGQVDGDETLTPGGMALCAEMYDLETLKSRDVAFDGTVKGVEGDDITFTVNDAYRGVDGDEVTLAGAGTLGGTTSVGEGMSLDPGTRLLVAGDDEFAWSCGFTQPYDAAVAAEWKSALAQ